MQKRTLRQLPTRTRQLARLTNELDSITRRLKHLLPILAELEMWVTAQRDHPSKNEEHPSPPVFRDHDPRFRQDPND